MTHDSSSCLGLDTRKLLLIEDDSKVVTITSYFEVWNLLDLHNRDLAKSETNRHSTYCDSCCKAFMELVYEAIYSEVCEEAYSHFDEFTKGNVKELNLLIF